MIEISKVGSNPCLQGDILFLETNHLRDNINLLSCNQALLTFDLYFENSDKSIILQHKVYSNVRLKFQPNSQGLFATSDFEVLKATKEFAYQNVTVTSLNTKQNKIFALHKYLCHASFSTMKKFLSSSWLVDTNISMELLNQHKDLLDQCVVCRIAKFNRFNPPMSSLSAKEVAERVHIDIMHVPFYLDGTGTTSAEVKVSFDYLISVDEVSHFVVGVRLNNQKTDTIQKALQTIVNLYSSYQKRIVRFKCDRQTSFISCKQYLNSINIALELVSSQDHTVFAERAIRSVREKINIALQLLPKEVDFPTHLHYLLIDFGIQSLNLCPKYDEDVCPFSVISGSKVSLYNDKIYSFGDIVLIRNTYPLKQSLKGIIGMVVSREILTPNYQIFVLESQTLVWRSHLFLLETSLQENESIQDASISPSENNVVAEKQKDGVYGINKLLGYIDIKGEKFILIEWIDGKNKYDLTFECSENLLNVSKQEINKLKRIDISYNPDLKVKLKKCLITTSVYKEMDQFNSVEEDVIPDLKNDSDLENSFALAFKSSVQKNPVETRAAVEKELKQMEVMNVWDPILYTDIPDSYKQKILNSFMLIRNKYDSNGVYTSTKGRLVINGKLEHNLFDSIEKYAGTCNQTSIHVLLSLCALYNLSIYSSDRS